jgi:YVTN family beta-propeller protein
LTASLVADANHPTGTRGLLLIDKLGAQIRFVDPVTYKERSAFKVATNPHDFALTADRKTAYVPLYGDGVYGRNPNRVALANQKAGGYKAYFSPDGKYLLTMNLGSASINIFDAANLRGMQHTLKVGKDPMGFAFSADGKTVLVANHGDGSVSVVDLATKQATGRFEAGTGIETLTYY